MSNGVAPVLECVGVTRRFDAGRLSVEVLSGVDLSLRGGQSLAVTGASGSGKSTLLHILGGLLSPTGGKVFVDGQDLFALSEKARGAVRNRGLGFVYQFHYLLPEFTALENVAMPLLVRRAERREAMHAAAQTLRRVGLEHRLEHKPGELSGGERQRTAIARALIARPRCLLADEPTGNLDGESAERVFELMMRMSREHDVALIVVTHDHSLASRMDRVAEIRNGTLSVPAA